MLHTRGAASEIFSPFALNSPPTPSPLPHISGPAVPRVDVQGARPADAAVARSRRRPRPAPRSGRRGAGCRPCSPLSPFALNTSSPGRSGSRSPKCIASPWPEPGRVPPLAVAADHARAVDDLVLAVAVHVADADAVVALPAVRPVARGAVVAVEDPAAGQLAVPPVPRGQHRPRVVAAAEDDARPLAVEVRDARQEAVHAVAVVVAPVGHLAARRDVVGRGERLAGRGRRRRSGTPARRGRSRRALRWSAFGSPITVPAPSTVPSAVLHSDLGPAVAVEVVDQELRVVRPLADVLAEVDPPQEGAVELVRLQDRLGRSRPAWELSRPRLAWCSDDLVLAVAVEVADGGVVRRVPGGRLQRDRQVRPGRGVRRERERGARLLLLAVDDRAGRSTRSASTGRRRVLEAGRLRERLRRSA